MQRRIELARVQKLVDNAVSSCRHNQDLQVLLHLKVVLAIRFSTS